MKITNRVLWVSLVAVLAACGPVEQEIEDKVDEAKEAASGENRGNPQGNSSNLIVEQISQVGGDSQPQISTKFAPYRNPYLRDPARGGVDYSAVDWDNICPAVPKVTIDGCENVSITSTQPILTGRVLDCDIEEENWRRMTTNVSSWKRCKSGFRSAVIKRIQDEYYFINGITNSLMDEPGADPRRHFDIHVDVWIEKYIPGTEYML